LAGERIQLIKKCHVEAHKEASCLEKGIGFQSCH